MDTKQKKIEKTLYNFDYESKEEKKVREKRLKEKAMQEKRVNRKGARKKADNKKSASKKSKDICLDKNAEKVEQRKKYDDEIIIGVTRRPDKENVKKTKQTKKEKDTRKPNLNNIKNINNHSRNEKDKKRVLNNKQKNKDTKIDNSYILDGQAQNIKIKKTKRILKAIKALGLITIIVAAGLFAMLSPIFNLKNVEIKGNNILTKETIISLSEIKIGQNIFKIYNPKAIKKIKENAYVNEVKIHKKLPDTVQITIQEREPSYMLEYGNGYVYINNQGYMLEISSIKRNIPILDGVLTPKEEYKEGNRLNQDDLKKLGNVIKIMDMAKNINVNDEKIMANIITKINMKDINNYILYFETERKIAYLGDCSYLETRIANLARILEYEKENSGEIFVNMNINTEDAYFRESV